MSDLRCARRVKAIRRQYALHGSHIRGLTLLELLIALAGTAVIGMATTALITGVMYGTQSSKDLRTLITRQMALRARFEAEVRESRMVLDAGTDYLVLWSEDSDDSGSPSKSEIQLLEFDPGTGYLMRYAAAEGITDEAYDLGDDFRAITNAYKGDAAFPGERWAEQVSSLTLTLDDADPQASRLVAMRVGLTGGEIPDTAIGAASLRNEVSP